MTFTLHDILIQIGIETASGILTATFIAFGAYIFQKAILKLISEAQLMRNFGVSKIHRKGDFSDKELKKIFYNAEKIQVFYKTGVRFWQRIIKMGIFDELPVKNPELTIQILLADTNPNNFQSGLAYEIERAAGNRNDSEKTFAKEAQYVCELLSNSSTDVHIEIKTDPGLYFLPYLIAHYEETTRGYLGLTIPPVRSPQSMRFITEYDKNNANDKNDRNNLAYQLTKHFDAIWSLAEKMETAEKSGSSSVDTESINNHADNITL